MKTLSMYSKAVAVLLALFLIGTFAQAQDITGQWEGVLSVQGMNLRIIFNINKTTTGYTSTMDSPDQGATGIPVATTTFDGSKLSLAIPNLGILYEGELKSDSFVGSFKQSGMSFPMTLTKSTPKEIKSVEYIQDAITGQWDGVLSIQGTNMRLVFHINKTVESYVSTMDSPDQGATGIPVATTTFDGSKLSLAIPNLGILYEGELKNDSFTGTFKQGGMSFPLTLKRTPQ